MRKEFHLAAVLSLAHNISLGESYAGVGELLALVQHLEDEGVIVRQDASGKPFDTAGRFREAAGYLKKNVPWVMDEGMCPPQTDNLKAIGTFLKQARMKCGATVTLPVVSPE